MSHCIFVTFKKLYVRKGMECSIMLLWIMREKRSGGQYGVTHYEHKNTTVSQTCNNY